MKIILETKRLVFHEFETADAKEMFLLNSDHDVIKYTGDEPFKSVEEAGQFILQYDQYQKYGMGRWAVLLKETNEYLDGAD